MINVSDEVLEEFVRACRTAGARGLVRCSSGNLSRRLDDRRMLATASRSWMENLTTEQVSVCSISDGSLIEGPKPTVEIALHSEILKARPDVNVVMHFQSPYATALSCRQEKVNYNVIPEIPYYIGRIAHVPFLLPGSKELAEAVVSAIEDHDMVVMEITGR